MHSFSHLSTWLTVYRNTFLDLSLAIAVVRGPLSLAELFLLLSSVKNGFKKFNPMQNTSARTGMRSRGGVQAVVHEASPPASCKVIFLQSKYAYIQFPHVFSWVFLNRTAWCLVFHPKSYLQYFLFCCITNKCHVLNFYPRNPTQLCDSPARCICWTCSLPPMSPP